MESNHCAPALFVFTHSVENCTPQTQGTCSPHWRCQPCAGLCCSLCFLSLLLRQYLPIHMMISASNPRDFPGEQMTSIFASCPLAPRLHVVSRQIPMIQTRMDTASFSGRGFVWMGGKSTWWAPTLAGVTWQTAYVEPRRLVLVPDTSGCLRAKPLG